ncbi:type III secretion system (T3SS) inner membrane Yop/YscD-like protein [Sediminihabitans luteus]|uniref:Type III secretion system (T3SS) inner membrane Yop/YscD-like protein n=1 Tax=Sediminihabitans luteus TaxID=1138585 RepID=A0A2M9CCT4_9CELL|nr:FHA domain-containing protein [Sediminihabitans luteus]PJJ69170.1 type III secretion system (T3SS) inner membrane Yop/YscD-like protein [Sediminihabitans luteus]GII98842.1 FHA domain-containing protein [Sediminihabitans luteus]
MSELTFTLLRLGYLVLLWVFVLSVVGVLRRDLFGSRSTKDARKRPVPATSPAGRRSAGQAPRAAAAPPQRVAAAPAAPPATPARSAGPTRLVVTTGALRGTTIPLTSQAILIGRAPGCTLVLEDDYSSSRHARVFPQGGQWYVEDLGSTNGTYIHDKRISGVVQISPGTPVRIGQSTVELQG